MVNAQKIQHLRRVKNITQHEFARLLGVNRSMVAKYESGTSSMGLDILLKMCNILEVTPNELLGYSVETDSKTAKLDRNLLEILSDQIRLKDEKIAELERRLAGALKKIEK